MIIDEADALVPAAQNALLKTLEEPPSASVFILVTSRPDALLPTVRSRCPQLRFRPLGADDVAAALIGARAQREPRRGRWRRPPTAASARRSRRAPASWSRRATSRSACSRRRAASDDPRRRLDGAKDLLAKTGGGGASDREQLSTHLRAMASLLRDVELLATGARRARAGQCRRAAGARAADRRIGGERGVRAFAAVDRALAALDRNAGVKVVADWLVLQL